MTRCCCCDFDPVAPSPFSDSVVPGGGRRAVHYRRKLKDFYCNVCYNVVVTTARMPHLRDEYQTDILSVLGLNIDSIRKDTSTMSMREFV